MSFPQGYGSATLLFKFEAAHRQPEVGGKCFNLHGHSWRVQVTLYNAHHIGGVNPSTGLSVEFSAVKDIIRHWIETHFDHATLLGVDDRLVPALLKEGSKLFLFGDADKVHDDVKDDQYSLNGVYEELPWPSVEAVAHCLGERLQEQLFEFIGQYVVIETISVSETETNTYTWMSPVVRDTGMVQHHTLMHGETIVSMSEEFSPTAAALRGEIKP